MLRRQSFAAWAPPKLAGKLQAGEMQMGKGFVLRFTPAVRTESRAALRGRQEAKLNCTSISTKRLNNYFNMPEMIADFVYK